MIRVYIPDNFIPERTYAIRTFVGHYLGLDIEIIPAKGQSDYRLSWADQSILIKDYFFGIVDERNWLDRKNIPSEVIHSVTEGLNEILILFGKDQLEVRQNEIVCHADLFAGTFFMLTRWEEAVIKTRDVHDRFPAEHALAVKTGSILRPVVDEYVALLRHWLIVLSYPVTKIQSSYTIIPTCDVDVPFYWKGRPLWKRLAGRFIRKLNPAQIITDLLSLQKIKRGVKKDPFDTFDYLMTTAEQHGLRFQFNMIGGGETKFEGAYNIMDEDIRELMNSIHNRGHCIGAHPSFDTYKNAAMMQQEINAISKAGNQNIFSSRQHYLRFDLPVTWQALASCGIKEDSTLGYAAEPGFRCGTCRSFPVFDILQRKQLTLTEYPLLIMDVSFRMYKKYTIQESIEICRKIIDQVKKHNGELVFLWHNSSLSHIDGWKGWQEVYESLYT